MMTVTHQSVEVREKNLKKDNDSTASVSGNVWKELEKGQ